MPVRKIRVYDLPEGFRLKKEEDILTLLRDVRQGLINTDRFFRCTNLKDVVEIIKQGKCITSEELDMGIKIDLSQAHQFLNNYKSKSEGGCKSCKHREMFKPLSDETYSYCRPYEEESDVDEKTGYSHRVEKYFHTGCDEKTSIFKPIEEILGGVKF